MSICSCMSNSTNNSTKDSTNIATKDSNAVTKKVLKPQKLDTLANALAQFLAGFPTDTFAALQKKPFYARHLKQIEKAWETTEKEDLKPIAQWIADAKVTNSNDSITIFYPFSGPDFLYVNSFFPYAKNYVMVGLENAGTLPKIKNLKDTVIASYLDNLRSSLRYINNVGYFVTSHMMNDFAKHQLDGATHLLLFYLARTNHEIAAFNPIFVDKNGNIQKRNDFKKIPNLANGIEIQFRKKGTDVEKTLYYFPFDLANANLTNHPEFFDFVDNIGRKFGYVKSASYLMHNEGFKVIREFFMNNCVTILQDDTGIPFKMFKKSKFQLTLFGTYTKTISDFPWCLQKDLKEAVAKEAKTLPFLIGYNSWHKETVLFLAKDTAYYHLKALPKDSLTKNLVFKVQIMSSPQKLAQNNPKFKDLPQVDFYQWQGLFRYIIGSESDFEKCNELLKQAREKGFKDAFIVAFRNNVRIPLKEALEWKRK